MIAMLLSAMVAFAITIMVTPVAVRFFRARRIGQHIREEVEGHQHKHGTPTMGGLVILLAVAGRVVRRAPRRPRRPGGLAVGFQAVLHARPARAAGLRGHGLHRLPGRLLQGAPGPQPGPAQGLEVPGPGGDRRSLRLGGPQLGRHHPDRLHAALRGRAGLVLRRLGAAHDHRHLERGELHRRPRRAGPRGRRRWCSGPSPSSASGSSAIPSSTGWPGRWTWPCSPRP